MHFKYLLVKYSSWNSVPQYHAGYKINYINKIIGIIIVTMPVIPQELKDDNLLLLAYNLIIKNISFSFTKA